jgi:hypothetical protein
LQRVLEAAGPAEADDRGQVQQRSDAAGDSG